LYSLLAAGRSVFWVRASVAPSLDRTPLTQVRHEPASGHYSRDGKIRKLKYSTGQDVGEFANPHSTSTASLDYAQRASSNIDVMAA
jgi:hypothetical protein